MITPSKFKQPVIERASIQDWLQGVVTARDDARTPDSGLRGAGNVVLSQDGTLGPRQSLSLYGMQPPGAVLGEVYEFVKTTSSGSENYNICMVLIAGVATPHISKDGGTWTICVGASMPTYSTTARTHFCQADNKVLILNGVQPLSYLDIDTVGSTPTITGFTAISTPSAPSATQTGLTGTAATYYYRISANSTIGETDASVNDSVTVEKAREQWDPATEFVDITWSAVTDATSYNVYVGATQGQELLIASGITGLAFKDDGTYLQDSTRVAPAANSTAGMKGTRATTIGGRVFVTGDTDNPRYVWFGGTGDSILDFSPFNGGGNIEIGRGTKEFPVVVKPFRDGRGNAQVTVLCRGTNGTGKRYLLTFNSIDTGSIPIFFYEATEDNGQDGTDSPDGVILYNDSLWYPSRDGFKTTGTKPQLQNILSTNRVSDTIQDSIKNLNNGAMDLCVGIGFENKLYWALPAGTTSNSEIWVLDLERKGAWMKPWNVAADWLWLYNDNDGVTHFCVLRNNQIYEFTYTQATNDAGVPFSTNATSGILKFSEDGMEWAKIIDVTFILLRPQGNITVAVSGKTEDASLSTVGSTTYNPETSISGWGEGSWESYEGWADSETVPTSFGDARAAITIEVDETLNWWKWELSTTDTGVNYQLSDVIVRFVRVGVIDTT